MTDEAEQANLMQEMKAVRRNLLTAKASLTKAARVLRIKWQENGDSRLSGTNLPDVVNDCRTLSAELAVLAPQLADRVGPDD